ncbi:MAG TPA: MFS transporter [Candidatus Limnocylindrales bacterium]|nr:MFS transporter [Candidatus Limnocylindrales bacterium]
MPSDHRTIRSQLRRNAALDLVAGVGLGITMAVAGALVPTVARQHGLAPMGVALLAAAPFLGNLLSAFAGRVGPRSPRQLALARFLGATALASLALGSYPAVAIVAAFAFWLTAAFSSPLQVRLWSAMYPAELRGRLIGVIGTGRAAAGGIAAVTVGVLADRAGVPVAVLVAAGVGGICALASAGLRTSRPLEDQRYSARHAVGVLSRSPELRSLVIAQAFFGGGMIAASALYPLVHVDRLALSLADVGLIAVIGSAATTLSFLAWGAFVDRRGGRAVLRVASLLGLAALVLYALAPAVEVLWAAALVGGLSSSGIDIGIQGGIAATTRSKDRAAAMAGWNAVTGTRGLVAPLLSSVLVQADVVGLTGGLLLCAVPAAIGVALYAGLRLPWRLPSRVRVPASLPVRRPV